MSLRKVPVHKTLGYIAAEQGNKGKIAGSVKTQHHSLVRLRLCIINLALKTKHKDFHNNM
jgi:hypothetical protein